jgi:hypothetical protein
MIVVTPAGKGNGAKPPTLSVPALLLSVVRSAEQQVEVTMVVLVVDELVVVTVDVVVVTVGAVVLVVELVVVTVGAVVLVVELEVVTVGDVVLVVELLVVTVELDVDVLLTLVLVVVFAPGQVQSGLHIWKAPAGEPAGQVTLPGGSQSSPGSIALLPHSEATVVDVVLVVELVVVTVASVLLVVEELVVVTVGSVVLLVDVLLVVVVLAPGQVQSGLHIWNAPAGEPAGHVTLPGGSQSSPGSTVLLPHCPGTVDDVVVDVAVVLVTLVVVVVFPDRPPLIASRQVSRSSWRSSVTQLPAFANA